MKRKPEDMTPEELVKYYVFPHGLSDQEKKQAEAEMKEVRMRLLREMTDAQRMYAELIRLRLRTEQYVNEEAYQEEKTFGSFLREYLTLIRKSQKDFSEDIGLHPTKLSRILHDRDDPNIQLVYRLEKHSARKIPAVLWWKIFMKKVEHEIEENEEMRKAEEAKVENALEFEF